MARWRYVFCTRLHVAFVLMILSRRASLSNETISTSLPHIARGHSQSSTSGSVAISVPNVCSQFAP